MIRIRCFFNMVGMLGMLCAVNSACGQSASSASGLRPPSIPLIAHDPYFSIWSNADKLNEEWPKHWTGAVHGMCGMVRIDGKSWRVMGRQPEKMELLEQKSVSVTPTQTVYVFHADGVELTLKFTTPAFPHKVDILARPVTYITWHAKATDGKKHEVVAYLDCAAEVAVNKGEQQVSWSRSKAGPLSVMRFGTVEQPVLAKRGDDLRIDWGFVYLAVPAEGSAGDAISGAAASRNHFRDSGTIADSDDLRMPRAANDDFPVMACALNLGAVTESGASRHVMLAYDDLHSIEFLDRRLKPYWRRHGVQADQLLRTAETEYESLMKECDEYDSQVMADLTAAGGEKYAQLCALSFRQCLAAHKVAADFDGSPLMFSKENFSNGCIATVDVIYPAAPFFLLFNPDLLKAQVTPLLVYSKSSRWKWPFAPHDLGTYPLANGQAYGGGERTEVDQMPVEESGNMLILLAALAKLDGNADYSLPYWTQLTKWAEYLKEKGLDPENQLCTDDFAGHLAHNANLSLKAILGLGSYGLLCEMSGKKSEAESYRKLAQDMATEWIKKADDGDHYRLTFDKAGTWSQKYNLVWDKLLGLKLFPEDVTKKEIAYYKTKMNTFGLPLDSRQTYTKLDWTVWTAALTESREDFDVFINPLYEFMNKTPDRVPLTDWFETTNGKKVGFQARSVVGGVYLPMLRDQAIWKKWTDRAK